MELKRRHVFPWWPFVPACLFGGLAVALGLPQDATFGRLGVDALRRMATTIIVPTFPRDAIASGKYGVVVAEIFLDKSSRVEKVEVLESPCASIAASVLEAVRQWKFPAQHLEISRAGKIVYYFQKVHGIPLVLSAEETPRALNTNSRRSRDTADH